jgi:hypothetical protein
MLSDKEKEDIDRYNQSLNAQAALLAAQYFQVNNLSLQDAEAKKIDDVVESYVQNREDLERLAKKGCKKCYGRGRVTFSHPKTGGKEIACDCVVRNLKKIL